MSSSDQIEVPEREVVKVNNNYTPDVARIKLFLVIVIKSQKKGENHYERERTSKDIR